MDAFKASMILEGAGDMFDTEGSDEEYVEAAQYLIDTGLAWQLQGFFGRICATLIDAGECTPMEEAA